MNTRETDIQFGIRLPRWLHAAMKNVAVEDVRSLNGAIVVALAQHVQARGYAPPAPVEDEQAARSKASADSLFG